MTNDYNTKIIEEYRVNDGRVGGPWEGAPLILVHDIGAKSGIEHVTPLGCFRQGDGRFLVVASNGGSPTHPAWYHNLKANASVDVGWAPRRSPWLRRSWTRPPGPSCGRSLPPKPPRSTTTRPRSHDASRYSC